MPLASHDCIYCSATGWNSSSDQGDLMIRWSYDQWLNGLFVLLSSLTDDLLRCKISSWGWYISAWPQISYDFFFFFPLTLLQPSRPFLFSMVLQHNCPVLTTSPILVPSVYFIIKLLLIVSRSGMEILIIPCAVSIQTFSWSPGKLNLSEFPWENPLIFSW